MTLKRRRGSTLGLVACAALVIFVIGAGLFFLSQLMGGGRQLSNAVDSASLSAARQAMTSPVVDANAIGTPEFSSLGINDSNEISLLTYNRAVALTLLVAMNAKDEDTQLAYDRAALLNNQLRKLGTELTTQLNRGAALNSAFDTLLSSNSTNLLGGGANRNGQVESSYMKPGESTNVYFRQASVPDGIDVNSYLNTDPAAKRSPTGEPYMKGYSPISMGQVTIVATPVFPASRPHLVSTTDFEASAVPNFVVPREAVPPNSFKGKADAQHTKSQHLVASVACAIVGTAGKDFTGRIPRGYIKIVNPAGIGPPEGGDCGAVVTDGDNDLFNKELFSPSSITQTNNGVFTTDKNQVTAWINYNNSNGDDEYGHERGLRPDVLGFNTDMMRFGDVKNQKATMQQLLAIKGVLCNCHHLMYDTKLTGPCVDNPPTWRKNYGRDSKVVPLTTSRSFMVVEDVKRQILEARGLPGERAQGVDIAKPAKPTGLALFDHNADYGVPAVSVQFGKLGTPWQLMTQVGQCAVDPAGATFKALLKRCNQIKPGVAISEVINALDSKVIPLGASLYLYLSPSGNFMMDETGPSYKTDIPPDGNKLPAACEVRYAINTKAVNTGRGGLTTTDAGFDDAPFSRCPQEPSGIDRAAWTPSTGYQNLMGLLEFENDLSGQAQWTAPN